MTDWPGHGAPNPTPPAVPLTPRVALFTGAYDHIRDGVSLTLNRLVTHLEGTGAAVLVLAPTTEHPALVHAGTRIPVPSVAAPGRGDYRISLGLPRAARSALRRFHPTLVHIATPDLLGLAALRLARRWGLPVVASYHTHFVSYLDYYGLARLDGTLWRYLRRFYRRCAHVYVPTPSMAGVLSEHGISENLRLWPRGVDTALFHPGRRCASWRSTMGAAESDVVVTFVSRIVPEKGLDVFADVVEELARRGIAARSVVVGDGPARAALAARLPDTRFTGTLEGEALARAYSSSDIFLFPSDTETFGSVTLEAMAAGLPVVCADAAGSRSLVEDGVTGFLAPAGRSDIFLERVARLVADAALRQRLARAARATALAYDWERTLERLVDYYRELA